MTRQINLKQDRELLSRCLAHPNAGHRVPPRANGPRNILYSDRGFQQQMCSGSSLDGTQGKDHFAYPHQKTRGGTHGELPALDVSPPMFYLTTGSKEVAVKPYSG